MPCGPGDKSRDEKQARLCDCSRGLAGISAGKSVRADFKGIFAGFFEMTQKNEFRFHTLSEPIEKHYINSGFVFKLFILRISP